MQRSRSSVLPVPITGQIHEAALQVAMRYGYHIYDALVVAAALDAECNTLYSEDLQAGQVIDGQLTIRNPFNSPASPPADQADESSRG